MTVRDWKWGFAAVVVLLIITSVPQGYLCYQRGAEWNGAYSYFDADEFAYSAYLNALIDGRSRRNDPYTGKDDGPYETLFSIQYIPAYAIAVPARIFGISASTAFIILSPLVTTAATLVLFVFLFELTRNPIISAIGATGVLCCGALVAQAPWTWHSISIPFPFLRRYLPAFPFSFFFLLALFVWRALTRTFLAWSILAGFVFLILVYSYFFLWTAAAAWLTIFILLWMLGFPRDYVVILRVIGVIALVSVAALAPYLWLLAHRAPILDQTQLLLEFTHRPDLLRPPEVYGILIAIITLRVANREAGWRDPKILFVLSFALSPILMFNQQLITGRSLQPFHYERFVVNYWILIAAFLALGVMGQNLPKRILLYLVIVSLTIGLILSVRATIDGLDSNIEVDKDRAVALKLKGHQGLAFISSPLTHTLSTTASNPVLWSQYQYTFSNVDRKEQKLRFYKYLYYSGATEESLRVSLNREDVAARGQVFGLERTDQVLTANPMPLTARDVEEAVDEFHKFRLAFDRSEAAIPLLSYAIVAPTSNLSNLDRWYERDVGEKVGDYIIYRLKLK